MGLLRSKEVSRAEGVGQLGRPSPIQAGGLRYSSETRLPKGPPQTLPLTTDTFTPTYLHTRKLRTPPWTHSHTNSRKTTQTHTHILQETIHTYTHSRKLHTHTHTHTHQEANSKRIKLREVSNLW